MIQRARRRRGASADPVREVAWGSGDEAGPAAGVGGRRGRSREALGAFRGVPRSISANMINVQPLESIGETGDQPEKRRRRSSGSTGARRPLLGSTRRELEWSVEPSRMASPERRAESSTRKAARRGGLAEGGAQSIFADDARYLGILMVRSFTLCRWRGRKMTRSSAKGTPPAIAVVGSLSGSLGDAARPPISLAWCLTGGSGQGSNAVLVGGRWLLSSEKVQVEGLQEGSGERGLSLFAPPPRLQTPSVCCIAH